MSRKHVADDPTLAELAWLAELAQASATRSIEMLDETARQVAASNARIAGMEAAAIIERNRD